MDEIAAGSGSQAETKTKLTQDVSLDDIETLLEAVAARDPTTIPHKLKTDKFYQQAFTQLSCLYAKSTTEQVMDELMDTARHIKAAEVWLQKPHDRPSEWGGEGKGTGEDSADSPPAGESLSQQEYREFLDAFTQTSSKPFRKELEQTLKQKIERAFHEVDWQQVDMQVIAAASRGERLPYNMDVNTQLVADLISAMIGGFSREPTELLLDSVDTMLAVRDGKPRPPRILHLRPEMLAGFDQEEDGDGTGPATRRGPMNYVTEMVYDNTIGPIIDRLADKLHDMKQRVAPPENRFTGQGATITHVVCNGQSTREVLAEAFGLVTWSNIKNFVLGVFGLVEQDNTWLYKLRAMGVQLWAQIVAMPFAAYGYLVMTLTANAANLCTVIASRPMFLLAAGLVFSVLAKHDSKFARSTWEAISNEGTYANYMKLESTPGNHGHALVALGIFVVKEAFGLTGEKEKSLFRFLPGRLADVFPLGWLGSAVQGMAAGAEFIVRHAPTSIERANMGVDVPGAPEHIAARIMDLCGASIFSTPLIVVAVEYLSAAKPEDEPSKKAVLRRCAVATAINTAVHIAMCSGMASFIFKGIFPDATPEQLDSYAKAAASAATLTSAIIAKAVDDKVVTGLQTIYHKAKADGLRGVYNHFLASDLCASILGGGVPERDERALYLGRALAASRLVARTLVNVELIESVYDTQGLVAAASLLQARSPLLPVG